MSRQGDNSDRWGRWCVLGLVAVACVCWFYLASQSLAPVPAAGPVASVDDGGGEASAPDVPKTVGAETAVDRSEARTTGLHGRLLDAGGEPLADFTVWLREAGQFGGQRQATKGDGSYSFAIKTPGDYELSTWPYTQVTEKVTLDPSRAVDFDLRLPKGFVATTGRLTRRGKAENGLQLCRRAGDDWQRTYRPRSFSRTTKEPIYRVVLPAGANTMGVFNHRTLMGYEVACYEHVLNVPRGVARYEWTIPVPASDLLVTVHDKQGRVVTDGDVTVRLLSDGVGDKRLTKSLTAKGRTFAFVVPGKYEVSVAGKDLVAVPNQEIVIRQVDRIERLAFVTPRAVTVGIVLRKGHRELRLPPVNMPVLRGVDHDGLPHEYAYTKRSDSRWDRTRRRAGFFGVPPGKVTIVAEDRVVDGELQFLGFDGIGEHVLDAKVAAKNVLEFNVTPRARVDLRACHKSGREQLAATVEVFRGEQKVRNNADGGCQRFLSFLPPGDYRIVIDRGGVKTEHALRVDRRDIRLRLRP